MLSSANICNKCDDDSIKIERLYLSPWIFLIRSLVGNNETNGLNTVIKVYIPEKYPKQLF